MHNITLPPALVTWVIVSDEKRTQIFTRPDASQEKPAEIFAPDKNESTDSFFKRVATYLNRAFSRRAFNRLIVVAPTPLRRKLRAYMNRTVNMAIVAKIKPK